MHNAGLKSYLIHVPYDTHNSVFNSHHNNDETSHISHQLQLTSTWIFELLLLGDLRLEEPIPGLWQTIEISSGRILAHMYTTNDVGGQTNIGNLILFILIFTSC